MLFHGNNCFVNLPQCYVIPRMSVLLIPSMRAAYFPVLSPILDLISAASECTPKFGAGNFFIKATLKIVNDVIG